MASQANEEYIHVGSFKVTIDGMKSEVFDSVTGLGIDMEDVPFQASNNQMQNRPGRFNARDITLGRNFKKDKELYNWMKAMKAGSKDRKTGSIILMDDESKEVARFNFFGAWPKGWGLPTLSKDRNGNSILLEQVTISVQDVELA